MLLLCSCSFWLWVIWSYYDSNQRENWIKVLFSMYWFLWSFVLLLSYYGMKIFWMELAFFFFFWCVCARTQVDEFFLLIQVKPYFFFFGFFKMFFFTLIIGVRGIYWILDIWVGNTRKWQSIELQNSNLLRGKIGKIHVQFNVKKTPLRLSPWGVVYELNKI